MGRRKSPSIRSVFFPWRAKLPAILHDTRVLPSPGMVLVTLFITFPFVVRAAYPVLLELDRGPPLERGVVEGQVQPRLPERPALGHDLELAALISRKICHDVINPVGAIYNGLEILSEEDDADAKSYALDVIRNVTEQASARLQFARFAFGASGGVGALIDLATAEQISRGFVGQGKHKLVWQTPSGYLSKDKVKLLLNLVAAGIAALPRGGEILR